jgi:poly(A) polymerase
VRSAPPEPIDETLVSPSEPASTVPDAAISPVPDDDARPRRRVRRATRTTADRRTSEPASTPIESSVEAIEPESVDLPRAFVSELPLPSQADAAPPRRARPARSEDAAPPAPEPQAPVGPRRAVELDEARIDPDVQKVVRRLVRAGYEAYLVGGCVRDLLLGMRPKDFDVATSARPEEVRELFRNSRVIGRRFRLVHVLFQGGKVIEVATFRRNPHSDLEDAEGTAHGADSAQLLIRSDNVFGEAHEDATRRDFTINALFYDVESRDVLDWVGGLADVERRMVNTIGEPNVRFREDPVRILRALKFAGRLDLGIHPDVYDAIVGCRDALALAARPRVSEEILRLLRGGQARRTIYLAWETGVLDVLLPELAALITDSLAEDGAPGALPSAGERVFRLLAWLDEHHATRGPVDDTVLWAVLLLEPVKEAVDGARDRARACAEFLEPLSDRLAVPRRFVDALRRIIAILPRLYSGRSARLARGDLLEIALLVAEAELHAVGASPAKIAAIRASLGATAVDAGRGADPAPAGGTERAPGRSARPRGLPRR